MKRKPNPKPATETEPVLIDSEPEADTAVVASAPLDKAKAVPKCEVCGDACAPNSTENLCWVCRRLKISAWRDADPQLTAQE